MVDVASQLCRYIEDMKKEKDIFDLVVLTHIDSDHIEGILRLLLPANFCIKIQAMTWILSPLTLPPMAARQRTCCVTSRAEMRGCSYISTK